MTNSLLMLRLLFIAGVQPAWAQEVLSRDTLAWVDDQPILARELRARVELMPWPGPHRPSTMDSVKSHALSALVAERLLATEAVLQGLTLDSRYDLMRWALTSVLQRDALFQTEVTGRRQPTRAESAEALRRYRENRTALAVLVSSRSEADSLASSVRRGIDLGFLTGDPRVIDHDTVAASFGMSDTLLERIVYDIGTSKVSEPRKMAEGKWILLILLDRTPNPLALKQGEAEQGRTAARILQSRLDGVTADRFYRTVLVSKKARSDSGAFFHLAGLVTDVWSGDTARYRRSTGFELTSDMVDVLHGRLGDRGRERLIEMDGEDLTIGQVVEMFRYEPFVVPQPEGPQFLNRLNEQVQKVAAGEYLAREAHGRGLLSRPSVQADLRSWNDYWAAGEMLRLIRDSVSMSREDVVAHLVAGRDSFRGRASVEVEEVFTTDPVGAAQITKAILQGTSIGALASGRSRRLPHIGRDGRNGWFDPADDPVVGFHALLADTGSIVGPVNVDGGFVTFRVLGIRTSHDGRKGADLIREVGPSVRSRKAHDAVNAFIAEQAQRRRVRIESEAVRRTRITSVPMFTRRYLGFGGWMNGTPMLLPLWEWVRQLPATSRWPL